MNASVEGWRVVMSLSDVNTVMNVSTLPHLHRDVAGPVVSDAGRPGRREELEALRAKGVI